MANILSYTGDDPTSQSQTAADEDSGLCIWRKIQFEPTLPICLKVTHSYPFITIFCSYSIQFHCNIILLVLL